MLWVIGCIALQSADFQQELSHLPVNETQVSSLSVSAEKQLTSLFLDSPAVSLQTSDGTEKFKISHIEFKDGVCTYQVGSNSQGSNSKAIMDCKVEKNLQKVNTIRIEKMAQKPSSFSFELLANSSFEMPSVRLYLECSKAQAQSVGWLFKSLAAKNGGQTVIEFANKD